VAAVANGNSEIFTADFQEELSLVSAVQQRNDVRMCLTFHFHFNIAHLKKLIKR
jgi:hypothetical protein